MQAEWVTQIVDQCREQGTAVFVKQTGERLARSLKLKSKKGTDPTEWPQELRVREFPEKSQEG